MFAAVPHWTNREAIAAEAVPPSLLVVGGGAIGLEIGQVMARFGSRVTVAEMSDRLVAPEEPEASELITELLQREGVVVHVGARSSGWSPGARPVPPCTSPTVSPSAASACSSPPGRRSDLAALGVGALGLDEAARSIPVDGRMRVAPGVWAVGDVTGKGAFTHVADVPGPALRGGHPRASRAPTPTTARCPG